MKILSRDILSSSALARAFETSTKRAQTDQHMAYWDTCHHVLQTRIWHTETHVITFYRPAYGILKHMSSGLTEQHLAYWNTCHHVLQTIIWHTETHVITIYRPAYGILRHMSSRFTDQHMAYWDICHHVLQTSIWHAETRHHVLQTSIWNAETHVITFYRLAYGMLRHVTSRFTDHH